MQDLISIEDLSKGEILELVQLTEEIKADRSLYSEILKDKTIGFVFQKPSTRTRVSFEVGIAQLGGRAIYLGREEIGLSEREPIRDVSRILSLYLDGVVLRTYRHAEVLEFKRYSSIPVINGLSDYLHPCQILADIYTIKEKKGRLDIKIAYIGDVNNIFHSLIRCCARLDIELSIATPLRYAEKIDTQDRQYSFSLAHSPQEAVREADVLYTDVWVSMGEEGHSEEKKREFRGYTIDEHLLSYAKEDVLFMHCLPAHRGEEVEESVLEGEHSIVFEQAENRLYMQKAILVKIYKGL